MSLNMPYKKYIENSILTSNPEELTLMLYNGLIKFITQAQLAIEEQDMEKAHNCIIRAKKILFTFENTLDMKYEVSKDILPIYEYMCKRLTDANVKKDKNILTEILYFAKELRDTWSEVMRIAGHQGRVPQKDRG
ncbi:MAG: flagellar export chaperone FliS [Bacillota bacterium]